MNKLTHPQPGPLEAAFIAGLPSSTYVPTHGETRAQILAIWRHLDTLAKPADHIVEANKKVDTPKPGEPVINKAQALALLNGNFEFGWADYEALKLFVESVPDRPQIVPTQQDERLRVAIEALENVSRSTHLFAAQDHARNALPRIKAMSND